MMLAQIATSTTSPGTMIRDIVELANDGMWGGAIGLGIMCLVSIAGHLKLLNWVPAEGKRWVAMGIAVLGAVGTGLVTGADWVSITGNGITAGLAAVGGWEFLGKALGGKQ